MSDVEESSAKVHMSVIGRDVPNMYPPLDWRSKTKSPDDLENPLPPIILSEEAPDEYYTITEYYFKLGFAFPLLWIAGAWVLTSQLTLDPTVQAPSWSENARNEEQRIDILLAMRREEVKWAKRCLIAFIALLVVALIATLLGVFL